MFENLIKSEKIRWSRKCPIIRGAGGTAITVKIRLFGGVWYGHTVVKIWQRWLSSSSSNLNILVTPPIWIFAYSSYPTVNLMIQQINIAKLTRLHAPILDKIKLEVSLDLHA